MPFTEEFGEFRTLLLVDGLAEECVQVDRSLISHGCGRVHDDKLYLSSRVNSQGPEVAILGAAVAQIDV